MARTLAKLTPRGTLAPADTRTDSLVRTFAGRLEEGSDWRRRALPSRLAPTDEERELMQARLDDVDRWLSPSRRAAIVRAVELMRGNLVIPNSASDDAVDGYVLILSPFPEPVIENVCARFMHGHLGDRVYAPMPAQVAHECRLAIADTLAERGRLNAILDAEVYAAPSEADRKKVADMHAEFVAETARQAQRMRPDLDSPRGNVPSTERMQAAAELEERRRTREAREADMGKPIAEEGQAPADTSSSPEEGEEAA